MKIDSADRPKSAAKHLLLVSAMASALFGCRSAAVQNAPNVVVAPEPPPAAAPRVVPKKIPVMRFPPRYEADLKKSINTDLDRWRRSIETRDADRHLDYYADQIETYYTASNVSKDVVRDDRRRAFGRFETLRVQLINVDIYLESKDQATVVFDKTWDFKKGENFSNGLVQQEIKMRKIDNDWLIFSEKDLEIYRYHNQ